MHTPIDAAESRNLHAVIVIFARDGPFDPLSVFSPRRPVRFFLLFQIWAPITLLSYFQNVTATGSLTGVSSTKTCTTEPDTADTVWTAPATGTGPTANGAGRITISEEARRTARPANATKSVGKIREAPVPETQRLKRWKTIEKKKRTLQVFVEVFHLNL